MGAIPISILSHVNWTMFKVPFLLQNDRMISMLMDKRPEICKDFNEAQIIRINFVCGSYLIMLNFSHMLDLYVPSLYLCEDRPQYSLK
jgi:hypothetical protein